MFWKWTTVLRVWNDRYFIFRWSNPLKLSLLWIHHVPIALTQEIHFNRTLRVQVNIPFPLWFSFHLVSRAAREWHWLLFAWAPKSFLPAHFYPFHFQMQWRPTRLKPSVSWDVKQTPADSLSCQRSLLSLSKENGAWAGERESPRNETQRNVRIICLSWGMLTMFIILFSNSITMSWWSNV